MGVLSALGMESGDGGAADSIRQGIVEWDNLTPPTPEQLAFEIERYGVDPGIKNPDMLYSGDIRQGPTNLADYNPNQQIVDAQYQSMNDIGQVAQAGITAENQAAINAMQTDQQRVDRGNREAILQNYRERQLGGAGGELASQLLNQQAGADRMAQQGFDQESLAQQKALQALSMQADLGGQIRNQEWGEQSAVANASDAINKFNVSQEFDTRNINLNRNYDAAINRQKINMANADIATAQRQQTPDNIKYDYSNKVDIAAGKSNQYNALANAQAAEAAARDNALRNTIGTAAAVAGTIYAGPAGGVAAKTATEKVL